jgi:ring-1,2-phenylacetyl-CoA epoxidase subunit PaaB
MNDAQRSANALPLWEVFVRSAHGLAHKHVGSLHAADPENALQNARDVYTRRNEGVSLWVVKSSDIVASAPGERESFFGPSEDKAYRHPTHYTVPAGVKNL